MEIQQAQVRDDWNTLLPSITFVPPCHTDTGKSGHGSTSSRSVTELATYQLCTSEPDSSYMRIVSDAYVNTMEDESKYHGNNAWFHRVRSIKLSAVKSFSFNQTIAKNNMMSSHRV